MPSCALLAAAALLQASTTQINAVLLHGAAGKTGTAREIAHFDVFVQRFGRSYQEGSAEYKKRREIYEGLATAARKQNAQVGRLWTAGINDLWDLDEEEFSRLRGWRRDARPGQDSGGRSTATGLVQTGAAGQVPDALPEEKSWGALATETHVRNQGACGSCWAIAASSVLSAHAEIHRGEHRSFSPQQLVSCVENKQQCGGKGGCKGATVELAYAYVMEHGLSEDFEVPYAATDGTCGVTAAQAPVMQEEMLLLSAKVGLDTSPSAKSAGSPAAAFGMLGWERLPENKYEPLMRAVAERGPVAVSVSAKPWQLYEGGIFDGCPNDAIIDHAVVLLGYGAAVGDGPAATATHKHWTIQNSWGAGWGEGGRVRLLRQDGEETFCGTDDEPELGTGCLGGPKEVKVCGMCGILYDSVVPHF